MKHLLAPVSGADIEQAIRAIKPDELRRRSSGGGRIREQKRLERSAATLDRRIRIKGHGTRQERIEESRLIAEATGTRFVFDPDGVATGRTREDARAAYSGVHVDGAGWLDIKTREGAAMVGGDYGKKAFEDARRESVAYADELARRPDVDPEGPGEDGMSGFTLSLLQGLARHFSDPETRARMEEEAKEGGE